VPDNKFPGVCACADERALDSCRIEIRTNTFCDDNIVGNQQDMPRRRFRDLNSALRSRNVDPIQGSQFPRRAGNGLDTATVGSEGIASAPHGADRIVVIVLHQRLS